MRHRRRLARLLCAECGEAGMLSLSEAVNASGVEKTLILRYVAEGSIHFAETPAGVLLICLTSLCSILEDDLTEDHPRPGSED